MTTGPMPIDPSALNRYLGAPALGHLDEYFNSGQYTGGRFERFSGGGDRPETALRFMSDDIVAVSLLGVRIPGRAALQVLDSRSAELNALLIDIPVGLDLWQAPEDIVGLHSSANQLFGRLVTLPGIGWVTAAKLLARKRPQLIPVFDRVVKAALGRGDEDEWWRPLRAALAQDDDLVTKLATLHDQTRLGDEVSLLRVLDVTMWMREHGKPEPAPDAET